MNRDLYQEKPREKLVFFSFREVFSSVFGRWQFFIGINTNNTCLMHIALKLISNKLNCCID